MAKRARVKMPKSPKKPANDRRVLDRKTWRETVKKTRKRGAP